MSSESPTGIVQRGSELLVEEIQLPALKEHQVCVEVESAAFNPTDRLAFDLNAFGDGAVLGCDFTGIVTRTHPSVTKLVPGDRVAALVWGGEVKGLGAYSTHSIADERISFKVPANIGNDQASSVPLAANTAWLALFSSDCLTISRDSSAPKPHLLIWGGSSAVGYYAIQIARLHGIVVTTTCSPQNFEQVKEAGATNVFDYRDDDVVSKLQATLPQITHIFDTIGNAKSSATAAKAIGTDPGMLCTVRPGKANTQDVPPNIKVSDVFVFTAFPTPHTYRGSVHWPAHPENHRLSAELYNRLPTLLGNGSFKPLQTTNLGNLSPTSVKQAMDMNRAGLVSARKLCFQVGKTLRWLI
ncbi:chaperonin 10-like protein [Dactylonectria estremocensis]|uniref:Chaperonin 10-like protein n=1 Tax=Dactylonectria estremocensis TaxID=1079267 RepID=A0A9P9EQN4_9HYPO|nr:chaperonin 10-like protein [Dactylonectria estremocensis]